MEIEQKLTEHIQSILLELGQGFAFVGRQVHLEDGGQDFYLDLLFYHLKLRCCVVIALKACDFEPGFISQVNMYQNIVKDLCEGDCREGTHIHINYIDYFIRANTLVQYLQVIGSF